jgi:hypothetical protein
MKNLLSIPLAILILFTGISVDFSTHYCGGSVVASKVSLDGEIATCGMKSDQDNYSPQQVLKNHCCDNIASVYSICNNYFSSSFNIYEPYSNYCNHIISYCAVTLNCESPDITSFNKIKPPGNFHPSRVELPVLCIFRI